MKRSIRFATVFLLAGLAQVSLAGLATAENTEWSFLGNFTGDYEPRTDLLSSAISIQEDGEELFGWIEFSCKPGDLISNFSASVSTARVATEAFLDPKSFGRDQNTYPPGEYKVSWMVDNGLEIKTVWKPDSSNPMGGLELVGQRAFDLALDLLRAKKQVEITTPRGVVVNDLTNYKNSLVKLLKFCNL